MVPFVFVVGDDDDELLVRASAVLKSQGPENWSRGRPGLLRARTNSRSVRGQIVRENPGEEKNRWWGGAIRRRRSGVLVVFFSFVNGGRDLSQYIKRVSFGQKRPRSQGEPSSRPAAAWRRWASISAQVGLPVRVQCAQLQLVAALPAPVHASGTIGVGWVGRGRRGLGASASDSSCVASQGRHQRMSCLQAGSAAAPSRLFERRVQLPS